MAKSESPIDASGGLNRSGSGFSAPPRVSVGLPVYNGEKFVNEAILSLRNQSFADIEIVISDNCSTDGTESICREHADADPRIVYLRQATNLGAAENYNSVFRIARGEYFKWAAHDDVCAPSFVAECVAVLDRTPDAVLVAPKTTLIDENSKVIRNRDIDLELLQALPTDRIREFFRFFDVPNACNPIFGLVRRSVLEQTRLIGAFPASDMILLGRLAIAGKLVLVNGYFFHRREHEDTSVKKYPGWRERAAWFNPRKTGKLQRLVIWRWLVEYLKNVKESRLGARDSVICAWETIRWAFRHHRRFYYELRFIPGALLSRDR